MSSSIARLQLTLAVIKPDVVAHPFKFKAVRELILENNFLVVRSKILRWSRPEAERFYAEHRGKFFYNRLVGFMTSGPMCAQILAAEDAITRWRKLMGPTKTFRARHIEPDSIRALHGLTDTRNATHGSDSEASAAHEIGFFFPEFSVPKWYEEEEPLVRRGEVEYCAEGQVHIPKSTVLHLDR